MNTALNNFWGIFQIYIVVLAVAFTFVRIFTVHDNVTQLFNKTVFVVYCLFTWKQASHLLQNCSLIHEFSNSLSIQKLSRRMD
jgi:hypothetical protein